MNSIFQNIQKQIGKATSEILVPTVGEFPIEQLPAPTIGWLSETDYDFVRPGIGEEQLTLLCTPFSATHSLLSSIQSRSVPESGLGFLPPSGEQLRFSPIAKPLQSEQALMVFPWVSPDLTGIPVDPHETGSCLWQIASQPPSQRRIPLLEGPETNELRTKLEISTETNRLCPLTNPQNFSDNLNQPLAISGYPSTKDCFALLLARVSVSENLHKPLGRTARADGKRYADLTRSVEKVHDLDNLPTALLTSPGAGMSNRKTFERKSGHVSRGVSVWDLLFPLLQRPVNLALGTAVDLPTNLYSYQTKGVEFLVETPSALLGDDMGTGKTVQTSVALRVLFQTSKIRTALIVCPLSVIPNWDRELAKWAENLAVTVVRGDKEHRKICWRVAAHVWLTTYDTLRNDLEDVRVWRKGGFDLIALDEAQRVKNWSSGITRAVRELHAKYRWGLTGTPLENNTGELWTILNVLKPDIDGSRGLQMALRPMFLRRKIEDVRPELPKLVQNPVWLRLEDEQRRSYDRLEKEWVLELDAKRQKEAITVQSVLVLLGKLKQICNRCPKSKESSKLAWLRDSIEDIAAQGNKVLVFSQYTDEQFAGADWLETELAEFGALNYSKATSDSKRMALLVAFKERPEHKVFIGHPKTAGLGLNELVVANYVVHFDHWWNPAVMNQATARAHRPGQTKTVFAYDLWIENTYEEIISKLLAQKQGLYNEVIDSMSAEREPSSNLAFAVADTLFAKYGLRRI